MADAIEVLVQEHRVIEQVLASLEIFLDNLGHQPDRERDSIRDYAYFFREFVDTYHHGKEENILFAKMNSYGFSAEAGPILAMLSEQEEGRNHLAALESFGKGDGALSAAEREIVRGHALGYILRIRPHIKSEDDILFPIVLHSLPEFVIEEIGRQYADFEQNTVRSGLHEKLQTLFEHLIKSYPPNP